MWIAYGDNRDDRSLQRSRRPLVLLGALAALAVLCLGPVAARASAAQGDLDPSFGGDGKVTGDYGPSDQYRGVAVQADGKVVAVGLGDFSRGVPNGRLVRYNRNGTLDSGFGTGGTVAIEPTANGQPLVFLPNEVALQRDGKIVIVGDGDDPSGGGGIVVARYNGDGTLDTTFGGGDGIVAADIPPVPAEGFGSAGYDVAIEPGGKIVAAGIATAYSFGSYSQAAAIARFTPDGSRDPTFGSGGQETVPIGNFPPEVEDLGLALQPDGKSVLATKVTYPGSNRPDFFLARFTALGAPDPTFGGDGAVTTNFRTFPEGAGTFPSIDSARDVAIQPDGKIVAVGYSGRVSSDFAEDPPRDFALARYNPDGSLDQSFDGDGKLLTDAGGTDSAEAVVLQSDGKIVAGGSNPSEFGGGGFGTRGDFVLFRYLGDGSLDSGFGDTGKVTTSFGPGQDLADDLAIDPADGGIVAAGGMFLEGTDGDFGDFALARYQGQPPAAPNPPTGAGSPSGGDAASPPRPGQPAAPFADCPTSAANVIRGTIASESINGTPRADRIFAGTGNDVVDGLAGNDCIDLGPGTDRGQGGSGSDLIIGGLGRDRISGLSGNDRLRGGSSGDRLIGGFGNDTLHGQSGSDRLNGERGRDRINGGSANDVISAGSSNDRVAGDQGNDRINGNSGNDVLKGNSGRDRITGSSGRDRISGGSGNDVIDARDGQRDRISCGRGRDTVIADRIDRIARDCERGRPRAGSSRAASASRGALGGAYPARIRQRGG